ncbi:dihydrolipoyl dehydrogenase family protein [Buchananella felis]|uniref:dihydrolipoyl dehydrogenase family protein n=1 Tax=Buchananella felis TaxID=3231492 RepID=UPI003529BCFD
MVQEVAVEEVDLLVVGGGKAGKSLAMSAAKTGQSVVMVERDKIGGTCINVACIPTKTLVGSARLLAAMRTASEHGIEADGEPRMNLTLLREHVHGVVGAMVAAHKQMFAAPGLDFVLASARFVAPRTVEFTDAAGATRRVRGRRVVINTGATPAIPSLPGLEEVDYFTSETMLALEELPRSLAILGGGYIGVEFASLLALLGVRVTLLHGGEHILNREDADVAQWVAQALEEQGVEIRTGVRALAVSAPTGPAAAAQGERAAGQSTAADGKSRAVRVELSDGSLVEAEGLLVAVGRTPVTEGLYLEAAGVELTERGFIKVDDYLATTAPDTYAAGDVAGTAQFTHASWSDFRALRRTLAGEPTSVAGRLIPYAVFTTPELYRIGLSEAEARQAGLDFTATVLPAGAIPRAKTERQGAGAWKVLVGADGSILGAALFGPQAGEVGTALHMAMLGGLDYTQVRDAVIAHPTYGEGLNLLFDAVTAQRG